MILLMFISSSIEYKYSLEDYTVSIERPNMDFESQSRTDIMVLLRNILSH